MESLRVLPPVPLTVRTTNKTQYIDGVLVPKGTMLTIPVRFLPSTPYYRSLMLGM